MSFQPVVGLNSSVAAIERRWNPARSEPPAMDELHRVLSLADDVIRHKVLRVPEAAYGPPKGAGTPADV